MVALNNLLIADPAISVYGKADQMVIKGVAINSKDIKQGFLFVAIKGVSTDGHRYIENAIENGACAICCEVLPDVLRDDVIYLQCASSASSGARMIAAFYGNPSHTVHVIGVTGTNGKTSVATLAFQMMRYMGFSCGLISTVDMRIDEEILPATHTTPDPLSLQRTLRTMADKGCTYVFMEVSSHAAEQDRIAGIRFRGAVFTNMSHDHLDYHKTFDAYIKAKKKFFDQLDKHAFAIVNIDDKRGAVMLQNCAAKQVRYAIRQLADYKARVLSNTAEGLELDVDGHSVYSSLSGIFNAYNLLAVYALGVELGFPAVEVLQALSLARGAAGRLQRVPLSGAKYTVIVDYAHTPDALENVLKTIQAFRSPGQEIICIVGCGGDRDRSKRPLMAAVAVNYADKAIFTADNPRSEDPTEIIAEMMQGVETASMARVLQIPDRKTALQTGLMLAQTGAILLIAGKGHEKYQEIKGVKYPFDDVEIVKDIYRTMSAN